MDKDKEELYIDRIAGLLYETYPYPPDAKPLLGWSDFKSDLNNAEQVKRWVDAARKSPKVRSILSIRKLNSGDF